MKSEQPITILVRLTYGEAYRSAVLTARIFRRLSYIWAGVVVCWLLLLALAYFTPSPETDWQKIIHNGQLLATTFALPVLFVFVLPLLSAYRIANDERMKNGFNYAFSDAGMHAESSVGRADLKWLAFDYAKETRSAFPLFTSANMAHTFPKRCFGNAESVSCFRKMIREHVAKARLFDIQ